MCTFSGLALGSNAPAAAVRGNREPFPPPGNLKRECKGTGKTFNFSKIAKDEASTRTTSPWVSWILSGLDKDKWFRNVEIAALRIIGQ
jgi:hypothetical protein